MSDACSTLVPFGQKYPGWHGVVHGLLLPMSGLYVPPQHL